MTTNPPPDARNAPIYVATANVAVMDILSGREHGPRATVTDIGTQQQIRRKPILNGLINEYTHAA